MPVSWKWIELLRVVGVQLQFLTEFLRAHCGETVAWIEVPRGTLEELLEGSRRTRSKARRCRGERDSRREALCPRDFDRLQQHVQNQRTLDTSDISSVMSVGPDRKLAVDQSEKALRQAIRLCRDAQVKFYTRSAFGPIAETINAIALPVPSSSTRQ
jgi:hypothetical protein